MENNDESILGFIKFCWINKRLFLVMMVMAIFVGMFAPNIFEGGHSSTEQLSPLPETNTTSPTEAE